MPSRIPVFLFACCAALYGQNPAVTVSVDVNGDRRAINPNIYGVAHASAQQLSELNVTLNRNGGNNTSRYNWQQNADNRGQDWYFESIGDASSVAGERADTFIANTRGAGAQAMITIPLINYIARLGANRSKLASFSIAKYGPQTGNDWQWFPDAGNGIRTSGGNVTGNDPLDANTPNSSALQKQWVQAIVSKWGPAQNGGQKYYILDNEHSIWHSTHRDVHPTGATMDQILERIKDYAAQIKSADPGALIVGPEEWGWSGYIFSGYDQQWGGIHGWSSLPDRTAHGGMDYLPWLLQQLKNDGRRLLDVFTVHYYPQSGEFGNDTSNAMQLMRNRSTRSLWDPNYTDPSWINDKVMLIPRLRNWVNSYYYAGTPIGITEYNWGAEGHMNGATAQADILGIFGREGLDMAARWTTPDSSTPTFKAIRMYRNYDGNKSTFGDTSVSATGPNPDNVAVFAAQRSTDSALTVMLINKYLSGSTPVMVNLSNFSPGGSAQRFQLTSTNAITKLADVALTGSSLSITAPPQSITLLVVPAGTPNASPVAEATATPTSGTAPLTVQFSGAASSDPDGTISSYAWNFGDGASASGITVSHVYANAGNYTAVLTVTDNRGATATKSLSISVVADPNFVAAPGSLTGSGAKSKATLNWVDNANNEGGFYIERAPGGTSNFARVAAVGANVRTFTNTGLARGPYVYRVQAFHSTSGALSAYSNAVTVNVK